MPKRLLDVGNCAADHGAIRGLVEHELGAVVEQADSAAEALRALRNAPFDLVLVNRVFDSDGDDGLSLIRAIKTDGALAATPVMLITNYPGHAQAAVAAGAALGFGKRDLRSTQTLAKLRAFLE